VFTVEWAIGKSTRRAVQSDPILSSVHIAAEELRTERSSPMRVGALTGAVCIVVGPNSRPKDWVQVVNIVAITSALASNIGWGREFCELSRLQEIKFSCSQLVVKEAGSGEDVNERE
jgi:hypothetical protein